LWWSRDDFLKSTFTLLFFFLAELSFNKRENKQSVKQLKTKQGANKNFYIQASGTEPNTTNQTPTKNQKMAKTTRLLDQ
jgi:hypothetical protein